MLEIMQDGAMQTVDCEDYYIQVEWNGADNVLHLSLPKGHPQLLSIQERTQIYDSEDGQVYRVSKYDRGKSSLDLEAELDLDSLCAGALIGWDNRADTHGTQWLPLGETVRAILQGTGWTVDDQSGRVDVQQMETFYGTPLEAITQALEVWGNDLGAQYDNAKKIVHLCSPGQRQPTGAYLTEDLNLLESPQIRGKAQRGEYYNRLYLIGADGLMLPGSHYVEHRAENEPIVSHVEVNEDIIDSATLYSTAMEMVQKAAAISRSYTCRVADLNKLRPKGHTSLKMALYDTVILIDRDDYSRSYQEIARFKRYPCRPEKNEVTLSTVPGTLSATAGQTYSVARDAAIRAYSADKQVGSASAAAAAAQLAAAKANQAAVTAASTATAYITDAGDTITFGRASAGSAVSVQVGSDGLRFHGVRNQTVLWRNPDPAGGMAEGTVLELDLSGYAVVHVGFLASAPTQNPAEGQPPTGPLQFVVSPTNGVENRVVCLDGVPRARSFTAGPKGITFGAGASCTADQQLIPDPSSCVPYILYGFL